MRANFAMTLMVACYNLKRLAYFFGGSLRPEVKAQIEPAIRLAREYLESFGVE